MRDPNYGLRLLSCRTTQAVKGHSVPMHQGLTGGGGGGFAMSEAPGWRHLAHRRPAGGDPAGDDQVPQNVR